MSPLRFRSGHLKNADFVRHLDHEGTPAERRARAAHLENCPACATELRDLEAESRRVSDWLARYDAALDAPGGDPLRRSAATPHQSRSSLPAWLKAAAAVLLIATPALAVPGVRGWLALRTAGAPERAATTSPATVARVVRFVPAPGEFTIRFAVAEPDGALTVRWVEGTVASGSPGEAVLSVPPQVEPVVASHVLRLRNAGANGGRYTISLPAAVTAVRVMVGGRDVRIEPDGSGNGVVVTLE